MTGERLEQMYDQGEVSSVALLLFGIAGDLPEREKYSALSAKEKYALWDRRISERFGRDWRRRFARRNIPIPPLLSGAMDSAEWGSEGF